MYHLTILLEKSGMSTLTVYDAYILLLEMFAIKQSVKGRQTTCVFHTDMYLHCFFIFKEPCYNDKRNLVIMDRRCGRSKTDRILTVCPNKWENCT